MLLQNDPLRQSANLNSPTVVYGGVAPAPRQQRHLQQQQQQPATIAYDDEEAPSYEFRRNTVLRLSGPTNYPILTQVMPTKHLVKTTVLNFLKWMMKPPFNYFSPMMKLVVKKAIKFCL